MFSIQILKAHEMPSKVNKKVQEDFHKKEEFAEPVTNVVLTKLGVSG